MLYYIPVALSKGGIDMYRGYHPRKALTYDLLTFDTDKLRVTGTLDGTLKFEGVGTLPGRLAAIMGYKVELIGYGKGLSRIKIPGTTPPPTSNVRGWAVNESYVFSLPDADGVDQVILALHTNSADEKKQALRAIGAAPLPLSDPRTREIARQGVHIMHVWHPAVLSKSA
jgi:hypothetical protein